MLPFRCLQGDFDFPFFWFGEIWGRGCTLFSETTCHAQAFCMERHVPDFRCKYLIKGLGFRATRKLFAWSGMCRISVANI